MTRTARRRIRRQRLGAAHHRHTVKAARLRGRIRVAKALLREKGRRMRDDGGNVVTQKSLRERIAELFRRRRPAPTSTSIAEAA